MEPAVVSICTIRGGTQFNIIPSDVSLGGTVRTLSEALRQKMNELEAQSPAAAAVQAAAPAAKEVPTPAPACPKETP